MTGTIFYCIAYCRPETARHRIQPTVRKEDSPFTSTNWSLLDRYHSNHFSALHLIPTACSNHFYNYNSQRYQMLLLHVQQYVSVFPVLHNMSTIPPLHVETISTVSLYSEVFKEEGC